jgi:hypothetical protein
MEAVARKRSADYKQTARTIVGLSATANSHYFKNNCLLANEKL